MRNLIRTSVAAAVFAGMLAAVPVRSAPTALGPPLICHPIDIGNAKSIPADDGKSEGYTAQQAVRDTLGVLKVERSALVRMETIRRAVMRVHENKAAATELLAKVAWIALDAEASPEREKNAAGRAEAWMNAGYLAACYGQMGVDLDWKAGPLEGIQGYAWVRRAAELAPDDAEVQFAAALTTIATNKEAVQEQHKVYAKRAAVLAAAGSLVEKNLKTHLGIWGESLEKLRAEAAKEGGTQVAGKDKPADSKKK